MDCACPARLPGHRCARRALWSWLGAGSGGVACQAAPWVLVLLSGACVAATHLLTPHASQVGEAIQPASGRCSSCRASPVPCSTVYPTIPWLGPTLLGVAFGRALERDRDVRFGVSPLAGVASLAVFVVLRASGGVGSFQPIEAGWIGFLNVTKYPPSLTFLLLTLGANFVLLGGLELSGAARSKWLAPLAGLRIGAAVLLHHASVALCRHRPVLSCGDDDSADVPVLAGRSGAAVPAVPVVRRVQAATAGNSLLRLL